ncbi:MAG: GntR family transcriptional regulator [Eubacteriales bacterium]|nr:GntR family transcriptional regulator [Eubacteriales bacterium]
MIYIDYKDRRPIYEQIVERFQMLIVKGVLEADSQMPSVRELATTLAVNPNTVQKAYAILEQNGFIYPVKGRGNFVTGGERLIKEKQETHLKEFRKIVWQAEELGIAQEKLQENIRQIYAEAAGKKGTNNEQEGMA